MSLNDKPLRCPFCRNLDTTDYIFGDGLTARCNDIRCYREFNRRNEARDLFHMLWGHAKESDRYYKEIWNRLTFLLKF